MKHQSYGQSQIQNQSQSLGNDQVKGQGNGYIGKFDEAFLVRVMVRADLKTNKIWIENIFWQK